MEEYQVLGPDGQIYLHYDNWKYRWRPNRLAEYPCPQNHHRFDIALMHPRRELLGVPISRNPHSHGGYCGHDCFYESSNWSTIFGVHSFNVGTPYEFHKFLVESNCPDPVWGERITLLSTSSMIEDEPWGRNAANKFAYFRGLYWKIDHSEFLHDWIPLADGRENYGTPRRLALRPSNHMMNIWEEFRNNNFFDGFVWDNPASRYYISRYSRFKKRRIDWRIDGF